MNTDIYEIQKYEVTPEGYLKIWMVAGVPDKILDYGNRKEIINKDELFREESLNTVVGKPITLNHPPRAVLSNNIKEYYRGTALQTMDMGLDGSLVIPAIIHDDEIMNRILSGRYKYVSSAYKADKTMNADGVLEQSNRRYNHFAILTEEYKPRAGYSSELILDGVNTQMETNTETFQNDTQKPVQIPVQLNIQQPNTAPIKIPIEPPTPLYNTDSVSEKVELLVNWKPVLDSKGITINYDANIAEIKKTILATAYPEAIIAQVTDMNVDGFWLAFTASQTNSLGLNTDSKAGGGVKKDEMNFDSIVESERAKYIAKISGTTQIGA